MKTKFVILFSSFFLFCSMLGFAKNPARNIINKSNTFFTTANAVEWEYIIKDKTLAPSSIFKMENGVLQISGVSSGYLRTKKAYSNYTLDLEWRWTKSLGNSGVLIHIQPKDTIWPICYQVQQKTDAAGDIICMNGVWAKECTDSVKFTVKKLQPTNEKLLGEWNSMQVICKKNTLKVYVNGVQQNNISGLTVTKGFIGFQNEGIPIEFRKLVIQ